MTDKTEKADRNITVSNITGGAQVVVASEHVTQMISKANGPAAANQFQSLIDALNKEIAKLAENHKDEAQRVAKAAEPLVDELGKEKKSFSYLRVTADGLKAAAETVKDIAPAILTTVAAIVKFVYGISG
jgi:hypothetical protein